MWKCNICFKEFSRKSNLFRHEVQHTKVKTKVKCDKCVRRFSTVAYLKNHMLNNHNVNQADVLPSTSNQQSDPQPSTSKQPTSRVKKLSNKIIHCVACDMNVKKQLFHAHQNTNKHKAASCIMYRNNNIDVINTAFKSRIKSFRIKNLNKDELSIESFLESIRSTMLTLINEHIKSQITFKVNVELFGLYELKKSDNIETDIKSFNTKNVILSESSNFNNIFNDWIQIIKTKAEEFNQRDSGWSLLEILHFEVNINKYRPLIGSYYVDLPKNIKNKEAVVNVKNYDDDEADDVSEDCFGVAVISALFPAENNSDNLNSYPDFRDHLNFDNIDLPLKFTDIRKFEEQNNISINVFGLNPQKDKIIGPLHHTKYRQPVHINLLYYEFRNRTHFCWIKNLSRLVGKQLNRHNGKKHLCDGCLQYLQSEQRLVEHQKEDCNKIKTILASKPLKFENHYRKMKVPFVIYADFESIIVPLFHNVSLYRYKYFSERYQLFKIPSLAHTRYFEGFHIYRILEKSAQQNK